MDKIRRRVVVTLELGADSWEEAAHTLNDIQFRLYEAHEHKEESIRVTSGGVTSGWTMSGNEDPTITHDSYFEQIEQARMTLGQGFEPIY